MGSRPPDLAIRIFEQHMSQLVYLVPLFPLIGFLINGLLWNKMPKTLGGIIGSATILASFCVENLVDIEHKSKKVKEKVTKNQKIAQFLLLDLPLIHTYVHQYLNYNEYSDVLILLLFYLHKLVIRP